MSTDKASAVKGEQLRSTLNKNTKKTDLQQHKTSIRDSPGYILNYYELVASAQLTNGRIFNGCVQLSVFLKIQTGPKANFPVMFDHMLK